MNKNKNRALVTPTFGPISTYLTLPLAHIARNGSACVATTQEIVW